MKKRKLAGLYDPYLDVMGGGEKHILSILKVLQEIGYDLTLFWNKDVSTEIQSKLGMSFGTGLKFEKNIFTKNVSLIDKFRILKDFDVFFYVTDGSYFYTNAKKNFIFCMVPDKKLYPSDLINRLKVFGMTFIANSDFTGHWLTKWGFKPRVIPPYIDEKFLSVDLEKIKKDKIILSVGRFFQHLHSKKHEIAIDFFKKMKKENPHELKDFTFIIAGGLKSEDRPYFEHLQKQIGIDTSIVLKRNITYGDLVEYYKKSQFYWHFAGYGVDENTTPEQVEHFGISPLEAMAAGSIPYCFAAGGPKLFIKNNENGFLFENYDQLENQMLGIIKDTKKQESIQRNGQQFVKDHYSYTSFKEKVKEIILK